ncbi:MAG: acyl-CoA dehydrogenase family protein [Dehalococcoidia bacterium]
MDWNDSPEQAAFREEVRAFVRDRLPEYYDRTRIERGFVEEAERDWQWDMFHGDDERRGAAEEWAAALAERGWGAPHWPTEYGGAGLSSIEQFILRWEFALLDAPIIGGGGISLLGPTLLVHGTEEQKQRFLEPTLRGEILWAQGYSEPGAGSDLASLQTRAVRDGDEWVINGQKLWTSAGHKANWVFMLVRTDPDAPKHRGISFMLVDMRTPGVSVRPIISMSWRHATNETFYEDVRVPANQVVGEVNRGWYVGMTLLDYERSSIASAVAQRQQLDDLLEHVAADRSPHRADLIRGEMADRRIEAEVLFNLSLRIASMQAAGVLPNYEASMGKVFSTELTQRIARTGTKVFGLYANLWSTSEPLSPMHAQCTQTYVDRTVGTVTGGASEIQRNIIATRGLGLPRG